jgi:hypothetical protein
MEKEASVIIPVYFGGGTLSTWLGIPILMALVAVIIYLLIEIIALVRTVGKSRSLDDGEELTPREIIKFERAEKAGLEREQAVCLKIKAAHARRKNRFKHIKHFLGRDV